MTPPLAVIVPTRGRPTNAARLAAAFRETDALNAVPVFVVDSDDPQIGAYHRLLDTEAIPRLVVLPESRGMCWALNRVAVRYAGLYEAVGFMGDDHLPRTPGWDGIVLDALDSLEPRIVYGNDLLQGPNLPTAVFMQSRMIQLMGMMAPRDMNHLYLDNFWKELGEALGGLAYLDDVIIEHLHPVAQKAEWDAGYQRVNAAERDEADRTAWLGYKADGRFDSLVRRLKGEYGHAAHPAS